MRITICFNIIIIICVKHVKIPYLKPGVNSLHCLYRIVEDCVLQEVLVKNGNVSGVVTSKGYIKCKNFVNTAGMWARQIGHLSNPRVQV